MAENTLVKHEGIAWIKDLLNDWEDYCKDALAIKHDKSLSEEERNQRLDKISNEVLRIRRDISEIADVSNDFPWEETWVVKADEQST